MNLSQLQSICNAARTVTGDISLHFITIRYRYRGRNWFPRKRANSFERVFPRPPPVFLVRSHIYHAIYAATVPTFATLVPRHARFICIFIPVSLLCAYTKRAYTPISYQFRGNQKAPGCFPAAPTFKHNLERSNAINLKREGNGGLFSGVLRP